MIPCSSFIHSIGPDCVLRVLKLGYTIQLFQEYEWVSLWCLRSHQPIHDNFAVSLTRLLRESREDIWESVLQPRKFFTYEKW